MSGKKNVLIFGVANERSIAWGIARALAAQGAKIILAYQAENLERRVKPLAETIGAETILCDVCRPEDLENLFLFVKERFSELHTLVHSVAYAERADLEGRFVDTSLNGFQTAMRVSVFSLIEITQKFESLMSAGASIITLTYQGATRVVPNYNVMGVAKAALESAVRYLASDLGKNKIRVNAISAGPIKTLAAAGIRGFKSMLEAANQSTPLGEGVDSADVGALAAYLSSDVSRHMTGQVLFVDSGASILA